VTDRCYIIVDLQYISGKAVILLNIGVW